MHDFPSYIHITNYNWTDMVSLQIHIHVEFERSNPATLYPLLQKGTLLPQITECKNKAVAISKGSTHHFGAPVSNKDIENIKLRYSRVRLTVPDDLTQKSRYGFICASRH